MEPLLPPVAGAGPPHPQEGAGRCPPGPPRAWCLHLARAQAEGLQSALARVRCQGRADADRPDVLHGRLPPRAVVVSDLRGGPHHPGGIGAQLALAAR
eukprot:14801093-Alexandrium_andersonii.AAC.1